MSKEKDIANITDKEYEIQTIEFKIESSTPYDDVFRTILNDFKWMAIPVINEIFGKDFHRDEEVEPLQNEMYISEAGKGYYKRITDSRIRIRDTIFHMELQSTSDNTMGIRMAEYDFLIARSDYTVEGNTLKLRYPYSVVLYLRSTRNTPNEMIVQFQSPKEDDFFSYTIPVVKMQSYSIEDIFDKRLLLLIPFYIFNFEREIPNCERDKEKQELLVAEYNKIGIKLMELRAMGEITEGERRSLLELSKCVIDSLIGRKAPAVAERIGDIMGGTVIDYPTKRILKEGYDQGIHQGIQQGMDRINNLYSYLIKEHREDDIAKCVFDKEYRNSLLDEFNM